MKCKQLRPGFELGSPCPFPMTLTITLKCQNVAGLSLLYFYFRMNCCDTISSFVTWCKYFYQDRKVHYLVGFLLFFFNILSRSSRLALIRWSVYMSKFQSLPVSFSFGSMVKFQFFARFPVDHLSHPVVSYFILILWVCYICLLCDWLFRLYHHITYTCYSLASYLFFL